MSVLPRVSGRDVVRALSKTGWHLDHQTGSHMVLRQAVPPHRRLVVPDHKEVAKGTMRKIIRDAGMTGDEFRGLF
jgi:predicted RNA binding protein YcfA (HicA-like mRNA interferase family)